MQHVSWGSTERFSDVAHKIRKFGLNSVDFRAKIKLHGSNLGLAYDGETVFLQSRNNKISKENDMAGAANAIPLPYLVDLADVEPFVFYGEWAGKGIQSKPPQAVFEIPEKTFFIFALAVGKHVKSVNGDGVEEKPMYMITDPDTISEALTLIYNQEVPANIKVLPYFGETFTVHGLDIWKNEETFKKLTEMVSEIEKIDPYILAEYGIEGGGEGIVAMQETQLFEDDGETPYPLMRFKVKAESHDVVKRSHERARVLPSQNILSFVDAYVTRQRVEQMVHDNKIELSTKNVGNVIKLTIQDVVKEGSAQMEVDGLTGKDVGKFAPDAVRKHFFAIINEAA